MGGQALALLRQLEAACASADDLAEATVQTFKAHTDAGISTSFPVLGPLSRARVLAEIGDDRTRFADARSLKTCARSALHRMIGCLKPLPVSPRPVQRGRGPDRSRAPSCACRLTHIFASDCLHPAPQPRLSVAMVSTARTDCESMMAALGRVSRPSWYRSRSRSVSYRPTTYRAHSHRTTNAHT